MLQEAESLDATLTLESGPPARVTGEQEQLSPSDARKTPRQPRTKSRSIRLFTVAELKKLEQPEWLIEGMIPQGSLAVLYGPPAVGKSFLALDWMLSAAKGRAWNSHGVSEGASVYVYAEGFGGLTKRIEGWEAANGEASAIAYFVTEAVQLAPSDDHVAALLDAVEDLPIVPQLFVFDTLARCAVGVEENSAKEIGIVIDSADKLRQETNAAVLLVHHMRKAGESERGSTALRGAADVMIKLDSTHGSRVLSCEKMKDASPFESIRLGLEDSNESCVLVPKGAPVPNELTPVRRQCLEALYEAALDDGLSCTAWHEASEEPSSSFYVARKRLVEAGYVEVRGKRYFVTDTGKASLGLLQPASNNTPAALSTTTLHPHTPVGGGVESTEIGADNESLPYGSA